MGDQTKKMVEGGVASSTAVLPKSGQHVCNKINGVCTICFVGHHARNRESGVGNLGGSKSEGQWPRDFRLRSTVPLPLSEERRLAAVEPGPSPYPVHLALIVLALLALVYYVIRRMRRSRAPRK